MRKIVSFVLVLIFVLFSSSLSYSAAKKLKTKKHKIIKSRVIKKKKIKKTRKIKKIMKTKKTIIKKNVVVKKQIVESESVLYLPATEQQLPPPQQPPPPPPSTIEHPKSLSMVNDPAMISKQAINKGAIPASRVGPFIKGGLLGGTAAVGAGYYYPVFGIKNTFAGASYGLGSSYTLININCGVLYDLPGYYLGISLNYDNYSTPVKNILGVSGQISQGGNAGAGIFAGMDYGKYFGQVGYSTSSGILAEAGYKL